MREMIPYLNFEGKTKEALEAYTQIFGGEITQIQTFGDVMDAPEDQKNRVMHANFKAEGIHIMASDGRPGQPVPVGETISLSLNLDDEAEQTRIFDALSQGGKVTQPLENAFWGARFGMVTDRFNIHWMLNCQKQA